MEPTRIKDGTAHVHIGWGERNRGIATIITQRVPVLPKIVVERIHPDAVIPTYATEGDSGMDVYAVEDMILAPGETKLCATGLKFELPKHPLHGLGYRWELQARPRSGASYKTAIRVANAPGTIDNFFRGEVKIILTNTAHPEYDLDVERSHVSNGDDIFVDTVTLGKSHSSGTMRLDGKVAYDAMDYAESNSIKIQKGDRVAQLVFAEVIRPLEIVEGMVDENTDRGAGGFGHTGK